MFYSTNKLRLSTYFCTPSGKQKQGGSLAFTQFVRSSSFFLSPQKELQKNYRFFTAPSIHIFKQISDQFLPPEVVCSVTS